MPKLTRTHWEAVAAFALGLTVASFLLVFAPRTSARPILHTKVISLVTDLQAYADQADLCVAVGRGFKCAPIRLDYQCMTQDQRSGWWDKHQDPACQWVVVLSEGTRAETALGVGELPEKPIP